jgi:hypothetical protein
MTEEVSRVHQGSGREFYEHLIGVLRTSRPSFTNISSEFYGEVEGVSGGCGEGRGEWRMMEVEGRGSFHPQMPMNRALQRKGRGMEECRV